VWDATTGQELLTLKGHTIGTQKSVSFSPDGQRLASAGNDVASAGNDTVKLWDARPWTPELRAQSQARSLLTARREQMKSLDDLQASIRSDKTISDLVRQQALDWSELFWKNYAKRKSLQLNSDSWKVVRQPVLAAEQYQSALELVVEANSLRPNHGPYLNTLGVAQYRARKYKDALVTLTRSEKLNAPNFGGESPHDLVFLAMTRFQLGEQKQAADLLQKVKSIAAQAKQKDAELDAFIKEAESLIQSPQKSKPAA